LSATPKQPKKPYQKPSLKTYGDIRALTGMRTTNFHKTDGTIHGHPVPKTL
jgi:hypothetical protein